MMNMNNVYRWCDSYGGGLVFADSEVSAVEKLVAKYGETRDDFKVWLWTKDDYYDGDHTDVFDIYGD